MDKVRDEIINEIAARILYLKTLEPRNSDRLDFPSVAVWSLKEALEAAYEAGAASREPLKKMDVDHT